MHAAAWIAAAASGAANGAVTAPARPNLPALSTATAADGRVTGFLARSADRAGPINGGIYAVDRRIVSWIGEGFVSMEAEIFPLLAEAALLRGALYDGAFIDIGIPEDLARAQTLIPNMQHAKAELKPR